MYRNIKIPKHLTSNQCYEITTFSRDGKRSFDDADYEKFGLPKTSFRVHCDEAFRQAHPEFSYIWMGGSGFWSAKSGRNILTVNGVCRMYQYGKHLLFYSEADRNIYRDMVKAHQSTNAIHRRNQEEIYRWVRDATPEQVKELLKAIKK